MNYDDDSNDCGRAVDFDDNMVKMVTAGVDDCNNNNVVDEDLQSRIQPSPALGPNRIPYMATMNNNSNKRRKGDADDDGNGPRNVNPSSTSSASDQIDTFLSAEMERLNIDLQYPSNSLNGNIVGGFHQNRGGGWAAAFAKRHRMDGSSNNNQRQHQTTTQISQAIVAREMYQMGWQEREEALQELHGVDDPVEETPDFVRSSLDQMDIEIQTRCDPDHSYRHALEMASTASPSDAASTAWLRTHTPESDAFRLSFLRTDRFDIRQAAERFLLYFKLKESLYGSDKLTQRDVYLQDLDEDCIERIRCGKIQLLPHRDARGRAIMVTVGRLSHEFETSRSSKSSTTLSEEEVINNEVRAYWKLSAILAEDVETQRKGMVVIVYNIEHATFSTRKRMIAMSEFNRAFPVRMVACHACVDDPKIEAFTNFTMACMGAFATVRYRCHSGTDMEVQYKLMSFGIPSHLLPISVTGEVDRSRHEEFLKQRWILEAQQLQQQVDERKQRIQMVGSQNVPKDASLLTTTLSNNPRFTAMSSPSHSDTSENFRVSDDEQATDLQSRAAMSSTANLVVVPSSMDVCFGRGNGVMKLPGNVRYRKLIETHRERYENEPSKGKKSDIIREVVATVLDSGGRFLKQDSDGAAWGLVSFKGAYTKVSHGFRNQKRPMTKPKTVAVPATSSDSSPPPAA